ncbi:hypothetical protein KDH_69730 [Dictyobacter sp. S3.2.2.5]|uniref:N-acetylmuramoyl-L-alanine amidase n=1 Tax=Dictyobacter halimunensis TaxID=3026934 RepID=A0ABQ6G0W7_9CHLR|nr:hypothetical protein KDH_69730 [Dictyobacter sp. S3.2.2.5]
MDKDVVAADGSHNEGVKRRTVLKLGVGVATAIAMGGTEVWSLVHDPKAAHAAIHGTPSIIGCDTWGARPPSQPVTVLNIKSKEIIIHHTEFPNTTDYSLQQAYKLAHEIQDLHMDTNGWIDTGQHFTVTRGGYILEGRHRSLEALQNGNEHIVSAHCPGMNSEAIGIENEGTYFTETPPDALLDSLEDLCVYICQQYDLNANNIFGHWDFRDTDCPGIKFYSMLPAFRRRVAWRLKQLQSIPERTWPDQRKLTSGIVVQTIQQLLNNKGYTLNVSSYFDADTDTVVRQFQADHQIPVDGHVNNQTWEALVTPLHYGSSGAPVNALQSLLKRNGYDVVVNGTFDQATIKAVRKLQLMHFILPLGSVDLNTWCVAVGGNLRREFI